MTADSGNHDSVYQIKVVDLPLHIQVGSANVHMLFVQFIKFILPLSDFDG